MGALGVYLATLAPTIGWGDSPELVTAAYQLGVSHPTGYPLYMLLGHAAIVMMPFGDPGFRMNLLSALLAAAAVAAAHRLGERLTGSLVGGWATALTLALAPLFWAHALIAEVYALASLLTLLMLLQLVAWDQTGQPARLRWAALLLGLNLAHHLGIVLLGPGLALFALTSRHRAQLGRQLPLLLLLGALPLAAYLYVPLRAASDPWLNWGDAQTPRAVLAHVTGRFYRSSMFATPPRNVSLRVRELPGLWLYQLGWAGLALLAAGLGSTAARAIREARAWRRRGDAGLGGAAGWGATRLAALLLPWAVLSVAWGVGYWVFDYQVFYLPAVLAASLFCGVGAAAVAGFGRVPTHLQRPESGSGILGARALIAVALLLLVVRAPLTWGGVSRRGDWAPLRYGRALAEAFPRRAVVFGLGDNHWFPLIYVQGVERARPDVLLFNLWDTRLPASERLFRRRAAPDFVVPAGRRAVPPGETDPDFRFLIGLLDANVPRRPVVMLVERNRLVGRDIWQALRRYYQVARTNLPFWELYPLPPETPLATGGDLGRGSAFADGTRLLSLRAVPEQEGCVSWVRVDSEWLVQDLRPGEQLVARLRWMPTDSLARPARATVDQRLPLAFGYFPPTMPEAPRTWRSSFWILVPPGVAGKEQRITVGVERNGDALESVSGSPEVHAGNVLPSLLHSCGE